VNISQLCSCPSFLFRSHSTCGEGSWCNHIISTLQLNTCYRIWCPTQHCTVPLMKLPVRSNSSRTYDLTVSCCRHGGRYGGHIVTVAAVLVAARLHMQLREQCATAHSKLKHVSLLPLLLGMKHLEQERFRDVCWNLCGSVQSG
jgi:hypothetical protein